MNSNSCIKNDILLRNMIYGFRRMIYLLRKHDIISVPSYAAGIYHPPQVDIIIRYSNQCFAEQSYFFSSLFTLIFSLETTILEKREEQKEKSSKNKKKRQSSIENCRFFLVPEAGVEPARYRYHRILSPARLPIPSFRHRRIFAT